MENKELIKKLVCIRCPIGCNLEVYKTDSGFTVSGNTCKRGEQYGIAEVTAPTRTVTSTTKLFGGEIDRVPVKTAEPIPKDKIFAALLEIKKTAVDAPVRIGDIIVKNVAGTNVNVVATRDID